MGLADETLALDNSGRRLEQMFRLRRREIVWQADSRPSWVQDILNRLA
jgi:hypothetical protein